MGLPLNDRGECSMVRSAKSRANLGASLPRSASRSVSFPNLGEQKGACGNPIEHFNTPLMFVLPLLSHDSPPSCHFKANQLENVAPLRGNQHRRSGEPTAPLRQMPPPIPNRATLLPKSPLDKLARPEQLELSKPISAYRAPILCSPAFLVNNRHTDRLRVSVLRFGIPGRFLLTTSPVRDKL